MVGNWFVSEVVCDGVLWWWWWVYWYEFEEFPVTNGHSSRAIDTYKYWSNWRPSATRPVLSHLVGWRPI